MKKIILSLLVFVITLTSFGQSQQKVSVAVAANAQFVIGEIKKSFEKETGIQVDVTIGSSGKFTAQIAQGAPFDVFVSADVNYPAALYKQGLTADTPKVYANGLLVLWTARNDVKSVADFKILLSNQIKKIAIPNPKTAPYGVAAEEALMYYNLLDKIKDKLVYGESIAQTNQYIISLSADIGFTAKSVVLADEMKGKGSWIDVNPKSYHPIAQAAVVLKHGNDNNKDASQKFYNYLYSKKSKQIFKKYGYIVQ